MSLSPWDYDSAIPSGGRQFHYCVENINGTSSDRYKIANLKAKLVNKVKLELAVFEHDYLAKLSENQLKWIKEQSKAVEDGIFGVFDDEHPDAHCSMHQAIEVAKQAVILAAKKIKTKEEDISIVGDDGLTVSPIPIPEKYQKAYKTVMLGGEGTTEQEVLSDKTASPP